MQDYSWKCMECTGRISKVHWVKFSWSAKKLFKLKNLGMLREFVKGDLHIPSLVEEARNEGSQWWLGRTKGSAIPPWIPSVLFFSVLDRRCCAPYLGERSRTGLQLVIWRDLPHTYSCTCFIQKKNKSGNKKGLCRGWTPGSLNFIE